MNPFVRLWQEIVLLAYFDLVAPSARYRQSARAFFNSRWAMTVAAHGGIDDTVILKIRQMAVDIKPRPRRKHQGGRGPPKHHHE